MRPHIILFSIIILSIVITPLIQAGDIDMSKYRVDSVCLHGHFERVLVDEKTGKAEYIQSDDGGWNPVSEHSDNIQLTHSDQAQLDQMQAVLYEMREETWDDRYRH